MHIQLVIVATIILIIIAEFQNLRKVSWILLIAAIIYLIFTIIPNFVTRLHYQNEPADVDNSFQNIREDGNVDSLNKIDILDVQNEVETTIAIINEADQNTELVQLIETQNINIPQIAIAKNIISRNPFGTGILFMDDAEELFCFTAVNNSSKENKIIHNWKFNNREYQNIILNVGQSPFWRCWSSLTIKPELVGDWKVVISDSFGNYLESIEFSVISAVE